MEYSLIYASAHSSRKYCGSLVIQSNLIIFWTNFDGSPPHLVSVPEPSSKEAFNFKRAILSLLKINTRLNTTTHTFPETLVRIGLTDTFEMRLEWPTQTFIKNSSKVNGIRDLAIGFETQVLQQQEWRPQLSIARRLLIPTGNKNLPPNHVDPKLQTILSFIMDERFSLFRNI